jgi:NADH-quinone oxidoreductase subunit K
MFLKVTLSITTLLYFIGVVGVALNRKNIIITIMSIELMLLAVNLNFLSFSLLFDDIIGQIFVLFILTIAATESAVGLSILTLYHTTKNTITFDVVKNKNFNLAFRKRRDLNPQSST